MDHSEALRLQATEKYLLGELSPELREQYEEHYFDCEECASDVKAAAAFVHGARQLFHKGTHEEENERVEGWFAWLRPAIAAPALAALLVIVCYQSFVMIPKLRRDAVPPIAAQNADFVSLIGANSRSEGDKTLQIHPARPAILELDIPASGEFTSYLCQVQDASGRTIYQNRISAADAKGTVHLVIPQGSLAAGKYTLPILGEGSSSSKAGSRNEIERLTFSVEVLP